MRTTLSALGCAAVMVALSSADAYAGQFKNLNNTATLAVNGLVRASSSPQNTGSAMELEAFEFLTTPEVSSWTCRVIANATGTPLNMRLVGLDGTIIRSCTAPAGGVCNTPPVGLVGGHRFLCLVATQFPAPVTATFPVYTMAVQRGVFPLAVDAQAGPSGAFPSPEDKE
ncbi:MAG TPA: hypothetical protein VF310_12370 [Vicinamibacteria bacterium]